ncbi:glycosyltransferase [cf. Phormidesmis sp. LEGE 11477]|uniref:glycosyltransferase n=1 Tax=cf. Phormidesmis sp. LEGE 11477 TaxID=1828680 RepID=UPI00188192D0|nr:glycosyltransferase [cf. Phormidesmis sp. LEGE 11477]MBE9061361.1 glycosyltransferase [cf. Phormidesmis sp. LEGE 11477]
MKVLTMPDCRSDNPYQALLERALIDQNVEMFFPAGYRRLLPFYRAVAEQSGRIDVLHLHWLGPYLKGGPVLARWFYAAKLLLDIYIVQMSGVKVVWTVHNLIAHDAQHVRLQRWIRRRLAKIVDRMIVHNHSSKASVVELYEAADNAISVVPIGHYRDVYAPPIDSKEARSILGLPTTGNLYLWQGILRPYKGVEALLQLWSEHEDLLSEHTLVIAGAASDPVYREQIASAAAGVRGVQMRLEFIADDQMHLFFSAATAVVLPFKQILTSSSLVLAMSYDKPVIAPRLGGIPETLQDADALLYDADDGLGLLHAIKMSMESDLSSLSSTVNQICDRLDWSAIAHKTSQLYKSVLHERSDEKQVECNKIRRNRPHA